MQTSPPSPPRSGLDVLEAIREGWQAFTRAPWPFLGFTLLVGILNAICNQLQKQGVGTPETPTTALGVVLAALGAVAGIAVSLWGTTGMVRGSWKALSGARPSFGTFTRWDGLALWRLLKSYWFILILVLLIAIVAGLLGGLLAQITEWLALLPVLTALAVLIYLAVTQKFLAQVALLEGPGMVASVTRGQDVVNPQWAQVFLLGILEFLILLVGVLACVVGLFVAVPVVTCVSTAAYRQIFGSEDRTGLLAGETL